MKYFQAFYLTACDAGQELIAVRTPSTVVIKQRTLVSREGKDVWVYKNVIEFACDRVGNMFLVDYNTEDELCDEIKWEQEYA